MGSTIRYGLPRQKMTNIEREVIDMEVQLRSAWLLVIKAVWMADNRRPNSKEASMSKVRAAISLPGSPNARSSCSVRLGSAGNTCWRNGSGMQRSAISMKEPVRSTA